MFTYKPELAQDDDDEAEYTIERDVEEDEDNVSVHDVKEDVIDIGEVCTFYSISVFVSRSFFLSHSRVSFNFPRTSYPAI